MAAATKQLATILGHEMAYIDEGTGDPIVFLHGNPTSSFLWRDIWPALVDQGRCIVPDLIGMGDSAKLPDSGPMRYDFATHADFVAALLDHLDVTQRVTWVVHDWGSALGFDWCRTHPDAVRGIAYMEAIVRPVTWDEWPDGATDIFRSLRSPDGEAMILQKNLFIEAILPNSIVRTLDDAEMDEYRRPFLEPGEDRRPMLDWPRQIPLDNEPPELCRRIQAYADWLGAAVVPKLFINAEPGAILTGPQREFCRSWPHQTEVTVPGIHFIQEDSAQPIAAAIADWLREL